jgi:hypothetical protein
MCSVLKLVGFHPNTSYAVFSSTVIAQGLVLSLADQRILQASHEISCWVVVMDLRVHWHWRIVPRTGAGIGSHR